MQRKGKVQPLPSIAAIYVRVSSAAQARDDSVSLDSQIADGKRVAASLGLAIDPAYIYQEIHTGEELYERPKLSLLREAARMQQFSAVIVYSIDRLSREPLHQGTIFTELQHFGVRLFIGGEEFQDTIQGQIVRMGYGLAARIENETRRERSMRGKRERARRGVLLISSRPLYGYVFNEDKTAYLIDPITGAIIRRIFTSAASGTTLRKIATELTNEGVPTPTGRSLRWDQTVIYNMLCSPGYWGEHRIFRTKAVKLSATDRPYYKQSSRRIPSDDDEQIVFSPDIVPPIVTKELAMQVQERMKLNKQMASRNNRRPWDTLLHGGFIKCGYCGKSMGMGRHYDRIDANGALRSYYVCRVALRMKGACSTHTINTSTADDIIWRKITDILLHPDIIAAEVEKQKAHGDPGEAAIASIDTQIAADDRKIASLMRVAAFTSDDIAAESLAGEIQDATSHKKGLQADRIRAEAYYAASRERREGLTHLLDWSEQYALNMTEMTMEEKRQTLAMLDVRVKLYKADHEPRMEMWLTLPLSGSIQLPVSSNDMRLVLSPS